MNLLIAPILPGQFGGSLTWKEHLAAFLATVMAVLVVVLIVALLTRTRK